MKQEVQVILTLEVDVTQSKENINQFMTELINTHTFHSTTHNRMIFDIHSDFKIKEEAEIYQTETSKYFSVSGYWKDGKTEFENYTIKEFDDVDENEDREIFYYGLSASDIETLITEGDKSNQEFVITSYKEVKF